jgi:hypothetical protein
MKKCFMIGLLGYLVVGLLGCATLNEGAKGVAGLSTKALEEGRKDAIKMSFNCSYNECRDKVIKRLERYGSYIYARDEKQKMLAIYISEQDTTPVGIFFKIVDDNNTQIEVSSPSIYGKEFIAAKIAKAFSPKGEEEESDAEKENTDKKQNTDK